MVFDRTRILTLPVEPKETYTYEFNNVVTVSGGRNEVRIAKRVNYRASMTFENIVLHCGEEIEFIDFYRGSRGTLDSFLYKSSIENSTTASKEFRDFNLEYLTYTQGVGLWNNNPAVPRWQIYKKYAVATGTQALPVDISCSYKRIFEPNPINLLVFVNGIAQPATYDFSTGLLDIPSATSTDAITVSCEFYHRVRFGDQSEDSPLSIDKLSSSNVFRVSNLKLIEVFVDNTNLFDLYEDKDFNEFKNIRFELPLEVKNSRSIALPTLAANLDNGREQRLPNTEITFIDESLEPTSLYLNEMGLLRDFFLAMKGRLVSFRYQQDDTLKYVRFNQDLLSITRNSFTDILQECKTVYDASTLDLVATSTSIQLVRWRYPGEDWNQIEGDNFTIVQELGQCPIRYTVVWQLEIFGGNDSCGTATITQSAAVWGEIGDIVFSKPFGSCGGFAQVGILCYGSAFNSRLPNQVEFVISDVEPTGRYKEGISNLQFIPFNGAPDNCGNFVFTVFLDGEQVYQEINPVAPEVEIIN